MKTIEEIKQWARNRYLELDTQSVERPCDVEKIKAFMMYTLPEMAVRELTHIRTTGFSFEEFVCWYKGVENDTTLFYTLICEGGGEMKKSKKLTPFEARQFVLARIEGMGSEKMRKFMKNVLNYDFVIRIYIKYSI